MSEQSMDKSRRKWLIATSVAGGVGTAAVALPLVSTFAPSEKAKAAAHAADDFVQTEPGKAVGIAAALGLALGVRIGRR